MTANVNGGAGVGTGAGSGAEDPAWAGVPRVMGQGLARLESVLPSTRGATLFGEVRRQLTETGAADRAISGGATRLGAFLGRALQKGLEEDHNLFERHIYLSPAKRQREAEEVAEAVRMGGAAGAALGNAVWAGAQKYLDRKDAQGTAERVLHVIAFAARADDGSVSLANQALLARVLDAFGLPEAARAKVAARPVPGTIASLKDCGLDGPAREAVAQFAFHARANAVGPQKAETDVVPVMVRLGLSQSASQAMARAAHAEYLSERDTLTFHYSVLQATVAGIGLHLHLPLADIEAAARYVVQFNPYELAREQNRRALRVLLQGGARLAAIAGTGHAGPALGIAASAAAQLLRQGSPAGQQQIESALTAYRAANQTALQNLGMRLNPRG